MKITIRKNGLFCYVFDDDAIIFHYLFAYKLKNYQVGFPTNTLPKITALLEEKQINYKIIGEEEKEFENNQYLPILQEALGKQELSVLKEKIYDIIENSSQEELEKILVNLKNK